MVQRRPDHRARASEASASPPPYPSTITVDGAGNTTTQVSVELDDFNHTSPRDLDVMLVSPTGQSLVLMGDTGGFVRATHADLTISDGADDPIPDDGRLTTGTYLPTDAEPWEWWLPPAPLESAATDLATFDGENPNGSWALYVADDGTDDAGWIGRWCLTIADRHRRRGDGHRVDVHSEPVATR